MFKKRVAPFLFLFAISLLSACSGYDKLLKSDDFDAKYEKAKDYYNKGEYSKALPLMEQLLTVKVGTPAEEDIRYYQAYCYFGQGELIYASSLFRNFYVLFPRSPKAEECLLKSADCLYDASPRYELDQSYTYKAIDAYQFFIDGFPKSLMISQANDKMDNLRKKLETKLQASAELYYKMEDYQAAAVTYENLLKLYPETNDAETINILIIRAYFYYAGKSIVCKRPERYDKALNAYAQYTDRYPQGSMKAEADALYNRAIELKERAETEIKTNNYKCDEQS